MREEREAAAERKRLEEEARLAHEAELRRKEEEKLAEEERLRREAEAARLAEVAKKATLRRYTIYPTASVDAGAAKARPDKHSSLVAFLPLAGVSAFARYNAAK